MYFFVVLGKWITDIDETYISMYEMEGIQRQHHNDNASVIFVLNHIVYGLSFKNVRLVHDKSFLCKLTLIK